MSNNNKSNHYKARFLLTGKCTATCDYCHNEGQSKSARQLTFNNIKAFIEPLERNNNLPYEVVLSGGEPTLHKHLASIAAYLKSKHIYVSMDSHLGHPKLLAPALPYLDELKVHLDSFDARIQQNSMGIPLATVLESIAIAKHHPLKLVLNHPVTGHQETLDFIEQAQALAVDCKLIELFDQAKEIPLNQIDFKALGYIAENHKTLKHVTNNHRIYLKQCGHQANANEKTLFLGWEGVRHSLDLTTVSTLAKAHSLPALFSNIAIA